MNFTEKLDQMRSISDSVDQYYSNGIYLANYLSPDSITTQSIFNDCYKVLVEELQDFGIFLTLPIEELVVDENLFTYICSLRTFVSFENLRDIFTLNISKIEEIRMLLEESDITENNYLHSFLSVMERLFPNKKELVDIAKIDMYLSSNFLFKKHVLFTLDRVYPKSNMTEENKDARLKYLQKINQGRIYFELAIDRLYRIYPSVNKVYLDHVVNLYDIEKITGNAIDGLIWAVMTDEADLHPELKKKQEEIINNHKTSTTHHIEYYLSKQVTPNISQLMELVAHHYEPESTLDVFLSDVKEMVRIGTTPTKFTKFKVFPDEDLGLIKRFTDEISTLYKMNS